MSFAEAPPVAIVIETMRTPVAMRLAARPPSHFVMNSSHMAPAATAGA